MQDYIISLLDPFDITIRQPKIDDGRASVSAGIRLRSTGQITIDDTNRMMVLYLFPGIANCINWQEDVGGIQGPSLFPDHIAVDGLSVTNALRHRVVSCGLRMELMNASLENDGYWEAARVPVTVSDFSFAGGFWRNVGTLPSALSLSNHPTYQTGKLRDLHRYQFKLNPENVDVEFSTTMVKPEFDMIVIKIMGRSAGNTQIMYNTVSNQEIIYKEGTALSRLQTRNKVDPNISQVLNKTRYQLPAVQIA
jgi:hypothetical protein